MGFKSNNIIMLELATVASLFPPTKGLAVLLFGESIVIRGNWL